MRIPVAVMAGIPEKISTLKKTSILANTNVIPAGNPSVIKAQPILAHTPGTDSFLLPKTLDFTESAVVVRIPRMVAAKDPSIRDINPANFSTYGKLQGLNHNVIRSLIQDRMGNIWFGTYGSGIIRFDGKYFTDFTEKEGFFNNYVLSLLEDSQGNIWFGTDGGGIARYNGKTVTRIHFDAGQEGNRITCILEDKQGNIWFGTRGAGAFKYDGKSLVRFSVEEGLGNNTVRCIFRDSNENIWFGTDGGGASKYDGNSFYVFNRQNGLASDRVLSISGDREGNVWFGTNGGGASVYNGSEFRTYGIREGLSNDIVNCIRQDSEGNIWFCTDGGGLTEYDGQHFIHFGPREGLSHVAFTSMLQDRNGSLWFGTYGGGVSKYDGLLFSDYTENDGLSNNDIYGLFGDKAGNVWMGPVGGGILKFDGKSFVHLIPKGDLNNCIIISILEDSQGNLWFGTDGKGVARFDGENFYVYTTRQGLGNDNVTSIWEDNNKNLWFGTSGGGVTRFDGRWFTRYTEKEGLCNNYIVSLFEDRVGNMWFGSFGGGISKFNGKSFHNFSTREGLPDNYIYCIAQDDDGNLWFGTNGGGVCRYDGKYFIPITEKEGLSNNAVLSLLRDRKGNLWLGTRMGLNKISGDKIRALRPDPDRQIPFYHSGSGDRYPVLFKTYTYEDGFIGIGCARGSICEDMNNHIWIGANEKVMVYHPEGDKADTIPPVIQLTRVKLFNEDIPWLKMQNKPDTVVHLGNGLTMRKCHFDSISAWYGIPHHLSLRHKDNFLVFNFIGISQKQCSKIRYQYRLDGFDINWSVLSAGNEASYGNLPPGDYTFRVKAMNSEGYLSKEYEFAFTIRPPWWKTWLFRSVATFLVIALVYGVYKWRISKLNEQKMELQQAVREKTTELVQKNEEMTVINEELKTTNDMLDLQKAEIEEALQSLKSTQNQLIQSEKMAALGTLAAGVAHEINNPLNFIQGGLCGLESYFQEHLQEHMDEVNPLIQGIQEGVTRAANIVTSLNQYSRRGDLQNSNCNVHAILDNCLVMLQNQTRHRIEIKRNYTTAPCVLTGNEGKLHQAMLNILANAVQAIEKSGCIILKTAHEKEDILIMISDTGVGISEEHLNQVMNPFFTTKAPGKGTGLGLAITYEIIREHKGQIEFQSVEGLGTTVKILLPVNKR